MEDRITRIKTSLFEKTQFINFQNQITGSIGVFVIVVVVVVVEISVVVVVLKFSF